MSAVELAPEKVGDLHQNAENYGLVWDGDSRRLVDPETGEAVTLERVVDEATAKAASYRIWGTEASIAVLKGQKKAIERQIRQREARLEAFRALYLDDLVSVAKGMMERARTKGQSIRVGFGVVGWAKGRRKVTVADPVAAAEWAAAYAPSALKVTVDLSLLSEARRPVIASMLNNLGTVEPGAATIEVRPSYIEETILPDAFNVDPGGEPVWTVRGDKPKGGDDGEG